MNKNLIRLLNVLAVIAAVLGILFSFLPLYELAIFPATIALVFGLISYYSAKKQQLSFYFARIVIIISLVSILISVSKQLFSSNEINEDTQQELKLKEDQSEEDAVKELEELDDLDGLE